jgi:hypothetical protein
MQPIGLLKKDRPDIITGGTRQTMVLSIPLVGSHEDDHYPFFPIFRGSPFPFRNPRVHLPDRSIAEHRFILCIQIVKKLFQ